MIAPVLALVAWTFVRPSRWPFTDIVAPAALSVRDTLYLMQSSYEPRPLLFSTDPASGRLAFYNRLMPWDHAAGWLLHREAGGYSAHFDGSPYRPFDLEGGLLCAPDARSWELAREALLGP